MFCFFISGAVSVLLRPGFGVPGLSGGQITPKPITRETDERANRAFLRPSVSFSFLSRVSQAWINKAFPIHPFFIVVKPEQRYRHGSPTPFTFVLYLFRFIRQKCIISADSSRKWHFPIPYKVMVNFLVAVYPVCFDFDSRSSEPISLPYSLSHTSTSYSNQANAMARLQQLKPYM